jgi:hypothetical protein
VGQNHVLEKILQLSTELFSHLSAKSKLCPQKMWLQKQVENTPRCSHKPGITAEAPPDPEAIPPEILSWKHILWQQVSARAFALLLHLIFFLIEV